MDNLWGPKCWFLPNGTPIEENLNSIIFKEVLNGNIHFFVVNEKNKIGPIVLF